MVCHDEPLFCACGQTYVSVDVSTSEIISQKRESIWLRLIVQALEEGLSRKKCNKEGWMSWCMARTVV